MMSLSSENKEVIMNLLKNHNYIDDKEKESVEKTLDFIENNDIIIGKENEKGHITASAFIINEKRTHMLLIYHKKCQLWLQPGGHLEKNESPLDGAIREMIEETGINSYKLLDNKMFDCDVHEFVDVKNNDRHIHYDLKFIVEASDVSEITIQEEEVDAIKWFPFDELPLVNGKEFDTYENFSRALKKLRVMRVNGFLWLVN